MKFNVKSIKRITTRDIHDFVTSPGGFLATMVVGGIVLAAAAKVGDALAASIERRKAREEAERNTIDNDDVILARPNDVIGEQPVIIDTEYPTSDRIDKVTNMLLS